MPSSFTRTRLFSALLAAQTLILGYTLPLSANAGPVAKQQNQVAGFYRMTLGDFEVTALYDGYVDLDSKILTGASAEDIQSLLARMFVDSSKGVQTAVNAYLINTGSHLVLVDTGAAKCFGPTLGVVQSNLKASGYSPEQVDTVLLTEPEPAGLGRYCAQPRGAVRQAGSGDRVRHRQHTGQGYAPADIRQRQSRQTLGGWRAHALPRAGPCAQRRCRLRLGTGRVRPAAQRPLNGCDAKNRLWC